MKRAFAFLLFSSLASLSYSQKKHEFGFLVRTGNYAIPQQKTLPGYTIGADNTQLVITQKAGEAYSLGLWGSLPMGPKFRLSAEITFNVVRFSHVRNHTSQYPSSSNLSDYKFVQRQKNVEYGLSLPLKLYYFFKKNGKMSLSLGAGVSHIAFASYANSDQFEYIGQSPSTQAVMRNFSDWEEFETSINLNTGVHYRLNGYTSVGIEYFYEKSSSEDLFSYYPNYFFCDCDCDCYGYYSRPRPNINSFSVSLRHNILGK